MKTTVLAVILCSAFQGLAGPGQAPVVSGSVLNSANPMAGMEERRAAFALEQARQEALAEHNAAMRIELQKILSKDPWRKIDNTTNNVRGPGWVQFQGKVEMVTDDGAVFRGKWGAILTISTEASENTHFVTRSDTDAVKVHRTDKVSYSTSEVHDSSFQRKILYGDDLFFVADFPYPARIGDGYEKLLAFDSTYYSFTNSEGQLLTIHKLIYGKPCAKIWSPEELAGIKNQESAKKAAADAKLFKSFENMAAKNDPYGWLRLGECYRDGAMGVEKDTTKAKMYLQKAADAGSPTAIDALKSLSD